jgi:uncharacterized protein with beta-barrel porin domain
MATTLLKCGADREVMVALKVAGGRRRWVAGSGLLFAAAVAISTPAFAQNVVSDPGFESVSSPGTLPGEYCEAASWTSGVSCGVTYTYESGQQHSGTYSLLLGNPLFAPASVSQTIGGLSGGKYTFSFWYDVYSDSGSAGSTFTAGVGANNYSFSTTNTSSAFTQFSQSVTLPAGSTTVTFTNGTGPYLFGVSIDDVSLSPFALTAPPGLSQNDQNVLNAINSFISGGGTLPPGFQNLFNLTPAQLTGALSALDGEASTGASTSTFQLFDNFLDMLSDVALGTGGGGNGPNGAPTAFAEPNDALPPDVALAYNRVLRNNSAQQSTPQNFAPRWTAWGSGYGGSGAYNGNAVIGSNNLAASDYGYAGGMDYHAAPDLKLGFALAGGGTNWSLAQNLGGGRSDVFQAAGYGIKHFGPLYLSGMAAFGNSWFTTNRTAAFGDQLSATFTGQSYALRGEAGYRVAVLAMAGITPYAAIQTQWFHTPSYSEADPTGGGFGLTFNAQTSNDTRTELGARADDLTALNGMPLLLRGRLAWAHDSVSDAALGAVFQTLPGAAFTVNGAAVPANSALVSAGAQLFLTAHWSVEGKFDGEFASTAQTYAGTGIVRYAW